MDQFQFLISLEIKILDDDKNIDLLRNKDPLLFTKDGNFDSKYLGSKYVNFVVN